MINKFTVERPSADELRAAARELLSAADEREKEKTSS